MQENALIEFASQLWPSVDRAVIAAIFYYLSKRVTEVQACISRIEANGFPVRVVENGQKG